MTQDRYLNYLANVHCVDDAVAKIQSLDRKSCFDASFLEHELIPGLGLNDEGLNEQPAELAKYFGKGLHLWQYPSQLARYLVFLAFNAKSVKRYLEIGCRWGGNFILISEWLQKIGAPIEQVTAVDPVKQTPFMVRYAEIAAIPVVYIEDLSTSPSFASYINVSKPDMVFIDGDHSIQGVMFDHLLCRKIASLIVHHDIYSHSCPATTLFWDYVKKAETDFDAFEFTDQYESVNGSFLGIGVLKRRT